MTQLDFILENFSESREYLEDGYYRVQDFGDGSYELEFSVAGYCGTFDSHPAIKFRIDAETKVVTFLLYRDMVASPIQFFKPETKKDQAFVQERFEQLLAKFYQAKHAN
ncbi:hypothetical protein FACS1894193_09580 [Bacilli bacterium]|nr:hypothetical protein FACS1894193_09580 [Bacilli bacterium]